MATLTYSGSWSGSTDLSATRTCNVSGGGGASGIINSVVVTLVHSTNAYSKSYEITTTIVFNGGSLSTTKTVKMSSDDYKNRSESYTFSGLTVEQANSISSVQVRCSGGSSGYSAKNVYVKNSVSVVIDYTIPSKLAKPTISVGATTTADATVGVSWTASGNGTANTLYGYELQYADSTNGSSYGSWTELSSYGTATRSITAQLPAAKGWRKFRVRAVGSAGSDYYSDWSESSAVCRAAIPTTPDNFTVTPAIWESGNVQITWEPSTATGASISKYYIEYQLKPYGGSYGNWTPLANTTARNHSYNPGLSKGDNIRYRIRAYSSDGIYSFYTPAITVVRTTDIPVNLTPTEGWYLTIGTCVWELPAAIDLTGAVCQYRYTTDSGRTWTSWANANGKSFDASGIFGNVASGEYFRYQVRVMQSNGDLTDVATSALVYKNAAPLPPVILAPVPASPLSPGAFWVVMQISTDPNGHSMSVMYSRDDGSFVTIQSGLTEGCVLAIKLTAGGAYRFRVSDQYGAYSEAHRTVTVKAETYTDSHVVAGTTRIKAAHINELRSRIEELCTFYGVNAPTWAEEIIAGTTSVKGFPSHITELRRAIENLYSTINSLGAGMVITAPQWAADLVDVKPTAKALNEIRSAVSAI